jgi:butyryl-CoA dehydrogenase
MGFIEETGAAQYYRDARILTIYEGTTAIQANDLIGRKTLRDGGRFVGGLIEMIRTTVADLEASNDPVLARIGQSLGRACGDFERSVGGLAAAAQADIRQAFAGSVPYLKLAGIVLSGWQLARSAQAAHQSMAEGADDVPFLQAKLATAAFYADHLLPQTFAAAQAIVSGAPSVMALSEDQF